MNGLSTVEFLLQLRSLNVTLSADGDRLRCSAPTGVMTPDLRNELAARKPEILRLLKEASLATRAQPPAIARIPLYCDAITPEMLPLVELSATEIERIVSSIPGGAANVQDIYPLTPFQEGIFFHHLMAGEGDPYLLAMLYGFDSRARLDGYLSALQAVMDRHDIFRTAVVWERLREPVQVVWRRAPMPVEEVRFDPVGGDVAERLKERFDPRHHRMDVRQAPLIRAHVTHDAANERWLLLMLLHHLVIDHVTREVMEEEIEAHLLGQADRLPAPLPFCNFVAQTRLGVSHEEHEGFFRRMLGDVDEPTAPFGLLNVQGDGSEIEEAHLEVSASLARRLRERACKLGVSVASLCHLAWAQVLARVSGREDVVFGTVLFGRMQGGEGAERVLGLLINTLPVRIRVGGEGVEASARATHTQLVELLRHEHASLALAQRCSAVPARTPLFSSLLNYRHSLRRAKAPSAEARQAWEGIQRLYFQERTNYPFGLSVSDLGEGFLLDAQVPAWVGPMRVCEFMHTALEGLVEALETAPARAARSIDVLPDSERRRVLEEWNDTRADYPANACVHELFEAQVERTPHDVALVFESQQLTYRELNARANQLAHYLRGLGVKPDGRVAICVERSVEMIVALLGVWKAGGAYVPLDPAYPRERLRWMLEDSGATVLLTESSLGALFGDLPASLPVLDLRAGGAAWNQEPPTNLECSRIGVTPVHLAYVIYTSGSTGTPKGVMVEHRGVCNMVVALIRSFGVESDSRVLQFSSFSFDASVPEILVAFCRGASLHIPLPGEVLAGESLSRAVAQNGITHVILPPAVLNALPEEVDLTSVRTLIAAGEALPGSVLRRWAKGRRVVNAYGPTEATVCATVYDCSGKGTEDPPIGGPIANTQIYILDAHGQPVPHGVTGELYIGGAGVARGYLNRPELTAERFLENPFAQEAGARMYRTGDLGRWLPDGNIQFLGRNDWQVKIRGFRIELAEIEARLAAHPAVCEAVVVAREDSPGEKRLVAYYATEKKGAEKRADGKGKEDVAGAEQLRAYLRERLPEYMVPAAYVRLEAIPLTASGKVNRKGLPAPEAGAYFHRGYEAPQGETETLLAALWGEVLKLDRVGRHDNFFELGGHSLMATQLVSRIRTELGIDVPLRSLFESPTVAQFAEYVQAVHWISPEPSVPVSAPGAHSDEGEV